MAVGGLEVELVTGGITEQPADRGRWVQNLWIRRGSSDWQTRPGFGQLASYNTTMDVPAALSAAPETFGYDAHLGSASVDTDFGTTHVVSVFRMKAYTGQSLFSLAGTGQWTAMYAVSIVDSATGDRWEEVLFNHTSKLKDGPVASKLWRGCYETNESFDNQSFVFGTDDRFHFHVYDNQLFFGNKITGVLTYSPSNFRSSRRKTVDSSQPNNVVKGYSESSVVLPMVAVPGLYPDDNVYLQSRDLPPCVAISSFRGALVWVGEREIYFSESNVPNSFRSLSFVVVPSQDPVTAVQVMLDSIMVFTKSETFLYQPSAGDDLSQGGFVTTSNSVGCLGPNSVSKFGHNVAWVDRNGIYASANGLNVERISDSIHEFFAGGVTCPLNHYLTNNGATNVSADVQPRTLIKFDSNDFMSLAFWEKEEQLLFCSPSNKVIWCFSKGVWSIWTVESCASEAAGSSLVKANHNIKDPFILIGDDRLFCVGSFDEDVSTDASSNTGCSNSAYYLLEAGRGGALDRSYEYEDYRSVSNFYSLYPVVAGPGGSFTIPDDARFYFDEPELDPVSGDLFQPIFVYPGPNTAWGQIQAVDLQFTFSATDWQLRENPAVAGELFEQLPTERLAVSASYAIKTVNNATGATRIQLAAGAGVLQMAAEQKSPLFILRWSRKTASTRLDFGITFTSATLDDSVVVKDARAYVWNQKNAPLPAADSKAQSVDWAYKSAQIGEKGNTQVRSRGVFSRITSNGAATSPLVPNWLWGLFNTLSAGDWKGWSSQVVDFSGETPAIETVAKKRTIRTRFKNTSGVLATRTFDGEPKYGEYLVDDSEFNTIAISDSARGEHITYMLFGFLRDKAEGLVLASSKATLRPNQGSRRRTGR